MDSEIGCYLQQLRTVRQISTSQLARRAGIGRATLNRWQSGKGRPRRQELEAVLNEMAVSPVERTSALTLLATPIKRLEMEAAGVEVDYAEVVGPQPHCGDLLRALRLRNGKTQADVARLAGTAQATVARWECAEAWPDQARLHVVALALNVREAEHRALAQGPRLTSDPGPSVESLRTQWQACWAGPHPQVKAELAELHLLTLAAQTWLPACRSSIALKLLADIYAVYAERLYYQHRFSECEQMAMRAQDIYAAIGNEADPFWARAALRGASALARKGSQRAIDRAIRQLNVEFPGDSPVIFQAWMRSELGKMAALRGNAAQAVQLGREALSVASESGDLGEIAWRRDDMARIYLLLGRAEDALAAAPCPGCHPASLLVVAEAHFVLGHAEAARLALDSLSQWIDAQTQVTAHHTPYYRAELQQLLSRLSL